MNYESGAAFRRALEHRLRTISLSASVPLVRLRKMVAFDRFLARLVQDQPRNWVLKGGFALQLRLGERARTTKDVDVLYRHAQRHLDIHQALIQAAMRNLRDWFEFQVARPTHPAPLRFPVEVLLDGRSFETFHVDVASGDPLVEPAETLSTPALLEFAGIPPVHIPSYPLTQQIAEKVHAYSRSYMAGQSTRIKDWVDMLLIAGLARFDGRILRRAIQATFEARQTHPLPSNLRRPPDAWTLAFRRLSRDMDLGYDSLDAAAQALARFLDPVLEGEVSGIWSPMTWSWH